MTHRWQVTDSSGNMEVFNIDNWDFCVESHLLQLTRDGLNVACFINPISWILKEPITTELLREIAARKKGKA